MKMFENKLGKNIRQFRKAKNMKQDVLAKELNIRRQTVSAYECGITVPDIYTLMHMADIFGVTLDELVGREYRPQERSE